MDGRLPSPPHSSRVAFDRFELDLRSGELRKDGRKIRLQAQPFQLLALLIEHAGEVVTREEVCQALWHADTFVDFDHGVAVAINKIREALGDSAERPRFIETLPKRGYRFITPVEIPVEEVLRSNAVPAIDRQDDGFRSENGPLQTEPREPSEHQASTVPPAKRAWTPAVISIALAIAVVGLFAAGLRREPAPRSTAYTQLTNFSNAVFSPAVSPDGRMIAFIRSDADGFPLFGEIYTKLLPDGEPVQLTHDGWPKYGVTFSPDGSRVAYTLAGKDGWNTETVSALGGEPRLFLSNAAGLTWLDDQHVLFSQILAGLHMQSVTSTSTRSDLRAIYTPQHERGMAHYSRVSLNRKWVLIVEMGATGEWQRCRLVPFDGSSAGTQVGPAGGCTAAAWSPDGKWMYFSVRINGASHLWRQSFPNGETEQITSGPTEEEGVAVTPDGRSLISAVGMDESGIWLHDARGEHQIASEGYAFLPTFSRDGRFLYYLSRRESIGSPQELWVTDLSSGKSDPVIENFSISDYDISLDGKEVVFSTMSSGSSEICLAPLDRSYAPRVLTSSGEHTPRFGPDNDLIFIAAEAGKNYLFRMKKDGSDRRKVVDQPITFFRAISPDRRWVVAGVPVNAVPGAADVAFPVDGGAPRTICPTICMEKWSPDGSRFYVRPLAEDGSTGTTIVIPVPRGKSLPDDLPPDGIRSTQDSAAVHGATLIDLSVIDPTHWGYDIAPGMTADTFVYVKTTIHRNLFQIPVP